MRRERKSGREGGERGGRKVKKEKGKKRETVNEHLCRVSCVMRLCGAGLKVSLQPESDFEPLLRCSPTV